MPPKATPTGEKKERATNFRTYETQARLLSALVASLGSNPRIDYKRKCFSHWLTPPVSPPHSSSLFVFSRCFRPLLGTHLIILFAFLDHGGLAGGSGERTAAKGIRLVPMMIRLIRWSL